ncbi:hypothetical protein [Ruegeria sp. HKCCD8929]|uniref:hypothetical protein n=1 Tax=Ruegeria sp. HKCCD8929 TaxID=2683006 RepID=UPI001489D648|nr:hypothetical protein [Ruegeria sp. HKCCD8929]
MKIDPDAKTPARRIHKRGKSQKANYLSGPKLAGMVQTESSLESAAVYLGMIDPRVREIAPQPVTFDLDTGKIYGTKDDLTREYVGSGKSPRAYTPDLLFTLNCGDQVFVETKSNWVIAKDPDCLKLPARLALFGHRLLLVTDEVITSALSYNVKLLRLHADCVLTPPVLNAVAKLGVGPFTVVDAMQATGLRKRDIIGSILSGALRCDIQIHEIKPKTYLWAAGGSTAHLEILSL